MGIGVTKYGIDMSGTTANRTAIDNAPLGTVFYDTTLSQAFVYGSSGWETASGGSTGAGAVNGATVSVVEGGSDAMHRTVLTLASTPISIVSVTTGAGVGGTKVYDFPEGRIQLHGCTGILSVAIATASQADFTDSTPEGDMGIGTVAPANADALGTDATDDDFGTATAIAMTAYADTSVVIPSEASANFDGTSTAKDLYVNALIDAADIDDDATTEILVSGTITIHWSNLGDA